MTDGSHIPVLGADVTLRRAADGEAWELQIAGQSIQPNDIAAEVLLLVNGGRSIDGMVDLLALRYTAPRADIARDVITVLDDLAARGALQLRQPPAWKAPLSMFWTWLGLLFRRRPG